MHTYKDELIEFLGEPENMKFLLEVEPLIPDAKRHKLQKATRQFLNKYIIDNINGNLGDDFEIKINGDDCLISNKIHNKEAYCFAIYLGHGDSNYYFGIIGPANINSIPELNNLKEELLTYPMRKPWQHWLTWQYFSRKREELLVLPDSAFDEIFIEWSNSFWDFVAEFSNKIKEINQMHRELIA